MLLGFEEHLPPPPHSPLVFTSPVKSLQIPVFVFCESGKRWNHSATCLYLNITLDIVPLKAQFISKHSALNEIEMSEAMWGHGLTGGEKFYIQDKHKRDSFVFSSLYIYNLQSQSLQYTLYFYIILSLSLSFPPWSRKEEHQ